MINQPEWVRAAIASGNQLHYRKSNPYLHNALNISILSGLVIALIGVALAGAAVPAALYIPIAGFAFGLLYFATITLVNHEGCHGMFVISKSRSRALFWNRFFGWTVCLFLAMHFRLDWEKNHHHDHHRRPIEDDGPIYKHIALGTELVTRCIKLILIPGYVLVLDKQFTRADQVQTRASRRFCLPTMLFLRLLIAIVTTLTISWTVPVAMFLGVQILSATQHVKLALEHGGAIRFDENRLFRSRTSLFPFRWFLMPLNISLHFEHHLNYCVPWYNLPRYQRALRQIVPPELQPVVFNEDVWEQLAGRKDIRVSSYNAVSHASPSVLAAISHPVASKS